MKTIHIYSGKSLVELRKQFDIGSSGFYDNSWWLKEKFAEEHPPKGKYEIDLREDLVNLTFYEQKEKLDKGFDVIHPAILAEAILTHYQKTKERLTEKLWFRTSSVASGYHVSIGDFDADGLNVYYWVAYRNDNVGVSAARKFTKVLDSRKLESFVPLDVELKINGVEYKVIPK